MGKGKQIKGLTIIIDGETKPLQRELDDVNKKTRDIQGELKSVDRLLKLDPKNTVLLAQKQKLLAEQVDNSREKLDHLKKSQDQVNQAFKKGEIGEEQYRHFSRQVVNAEQDLQGFERQLQNTTSTAKTLKQRMAEVGDKITEVGNKMKTAGSNMVRTVTLPLIAAGTALVALAKKAGDTADELLTLSAQTGIEAKTLQGLGYTARLVDVELEALQKGWAKTVKAMGAANKKGEDYIDIGGAMKLSIRDVNGKLKTSEQMFYDTIDAIGLLKDETLQEIVAQELFGKSYQDLMPLIDGGSSALKRYIEEAEKLGLIVSDADLKALGEFDDATEKLEAQMAVLTMQMAVKLLPAIQDLTPFIQETVVPAFKDFAEKIADLISWFVELDPEQQKFIGSLTGILIAAGPVLVVLGFMVTAIGALLNPVGLAVLAILAFAGGFSYLYTTSDKFRSWSQGIARSVQDNIVEDINDAIAAVNALRWLLDKLPLVELAPIPDYNPDPITFPGTVKPSGTSGWAGFREAAEKNNGKTWVNFNATGNKTVSMVDGTQNVHHDGTVYHVFQTNDRATVAKIAEEFERGNRRIPARVPTLPSMA